MMIIKLINKKKLIKNKNRKKKERNYLNIIVWKILTSTKNKYNFNYKNNKNYNN